MINWSHSVFTLRFWFKPWSFWAVWVRVVGWVWVSFSNCVCVCDCITGILFGFGFAFAYVMYFSQTVFTLRYFYFSVVVYILCLFLPYFFLWCSYVTNSSQTYYMWLISQIRFLRFVFLSLLITVVYLWCSYVIIWSHTVFTLSFFSFGLVFCLFGFRCWLFVINCSHSIFALNLNPNPEPQP